MNQWYRWGRPLPILRQNPRDQHQSLERKSPEKTVVNPEIKAAIQGFFNSIEVPSKTTSGLSTTSRFWNAELNYQFSATFGQFLYKTASGGRGRLRSDKTRSLADFPCPPAFVSVFPGMQSFLSIGDSVANGPEHELNITLVPSSRLLAVSESSRTFPDLELVLKVDKKDRKVLISSVKLGMERKELDLILPDGLADTKFNLDSFIESGLELDPRIINFIANSNLDIWGTARLKTPSTVSVSIPKQALRKTHTGANGDLFEAYNPDALVEYSFFSMHQKSYVQSPLGEHLQVRYSSIESGKMGGRRDEIGFLPAGAHVPVTNPEAMGTFIDEVHKMTRFANHPIDQSRR